jgi:hypothetical protein
MSAPGTLACEYRPATLYDHAPDQVAAFFTDPDMMPPGLVDARRWYPGIPMEQRATTREPRPSRSRPQAHVTKLKDLPNGSRTGIH